MKFHEVLRLRRKFKGLDQTELAKMVGVSRITISRMENARVTPKLSLAFKIAKVLDLSLDQLND